MTDISSSPERGIGEVVAGKSADGYGGAYSEHVLRLYLELVSSANEVSSRRQAANSFFLTLNTAVLGALGAVVVGLVAPDTVGRYPDLVVGGAFLGMLLCWLWRRTISSYRQLNSAKFRVIHELELDLPKRPFTAEWFAAGHGLDPRRYRPFTELESMVPILFALGYGYLMLRTLSVAIFGG